MDLVLPNDTPLFHAIVLGYPPKNTTHPGNNKALLRDHGGFYHPVIRPAISWGKRGIGAPRGAFKRFP